MSTYSDLQLDALRELANIGSGTASTALSSMLGRSVDISIPRARVLPFAEAVDATGQAEVTGIMLGVAGELVATVLLLVPPADAGRLVGMLGVDPDGELAGSALGEIGNVVGTAYLNALAGMTGIAIEPAPPATTTGTLGAIVGSALAGQDGGDVALLLDSALDVEGEDCSVSFVLVPDSSGVDLLLSRLGLG